MSVLLPEAVVMLRRSISQSSAKERTFIAMQQFHLPIIPDQAI
jgi:hypothetical protein